MSGLEDTLRVLMREEMRRVLRDELSPMLAQLRPAPDAGEYLSVQKAAAVADVHPDTIRKWLKLGRLPQHRAGRELRVLKRDLDRCLAAVSSDSQRPTPEEEAVMILSRRRSG